MKLLKAAEFILVFTGVFALGCWSGQVLAARAYQVIEERKLSGALHSVAAAHAAASPELSAVEPKPQKWGEGRVIGRLAIPRLGLSALIVEGVGDRDLAVAAGHIPGTSLPGREGNAAIAGHRDTFFRPLRLIRNHDTIEVTTLAGEFEYRVISTEIVEPGDTQVLMPTKTETLTLVTCYPFYFVGPAPRRFIVQAERLPAASQGVSKL